jgi:hypothetical protein
MKPPDQKIDASMQAYAKRWMKSLEKPRPTTTLGYFFVGLFILFWSSSLTSSIGFDIKKGWGALVFLGIALLLTLPTLFVVRIMAIIGVNRPTRSAFLFSAVIGPYINMVADNAWKMPTISHILGFFSAIMALLVSLLVDRLIDRSADKSLEQKSSQ